ncbi:HigA family addiction module antitoxin [Achromobacter ruhlandii]|uniref:HigA family addiction module antitoxin n=1 Tax=Achromobacter ruhlandii TaxID=72557 RepID=UPI003B9F53B2
MQAAAADYFPPGEVLKEELEARGWTQVELAEIMGRPTRLINEIIAAKKSITPETAIQLGEALGPDARFWMNLESQYQLSRVTKPDNLIARRSRLYARFPVRDMVKRGWIQFSENIEVLEQQFRSFFNIDQLDQRPHFSHAAKKTDEAEEATIQQLAWLFRARTIAANHVSKKFKKELLEAALPKLHALLSAPEEIRHAPGILADCGVRLVFIEALPGTKIDGACFWLTSTQPAIAMSLRFDRIDNFWFVLRHELEHVLQGHGKDTGYILDVDMDGDATDQVLAEERMANEAAADFCVPRKEMENFEARVAPYFSDERVMLFAKRLEVHVGIVAGQLRKRLNRYDRWSKYLVKVRHIAIQSAPTDGWGNVDH